ncbi:MAG: DUF2344 domain-containing protein [Lachnospiraceae bacterium]|nr:DUF2344 domain-containing protein [Lachnospiraceae bacterium]
MRVRVKFSKLGRVRFVGHLDMMRSFQKAIRRTGLPVRYSEGFSPHQILSFANPLSLGLESQGEYFDMELTEEADLEKAMVSFNAVLPEGFRILSMTKLPDAWTKKQNAMSQVQAAAYRVFFPKDQNEAAKRNVMSTEAFALTSKITDDKWNGIMSTKKSLPVSEVSDEIKVSDETNNIMSTYYVNAIQKFLMQPSIPMHKQTKKSAYEFDSKQSLYSLEVVKEDAEGCVLDMLIRSSSTGQGNVKPLEVLEKMFEFMGKPVPKECRILRLETFGERDGKLVPLGELGSAD